MNKANESMAGLCGDNGVGERSMKVRVMDCVYSFTDIFFQLTVQGMIVEKWIRERRRLEREYSNTSISTNLDGWIITAGSDP